MEIKVSQSDSLTEDRIRYAEQEAGYWILQDTFWYYMTCVRDISKESPITIPYLEKQLTFFPLETAIYKNLANAEISPQFSNVDKRAIEAIVFNRASNLSIRDAILFKIIKGNKGFKDLFFKALPVINEWLLDLSLPSWEAFIYDPQNKGNVCKYCFQVQRTLINNICNICKNYYKRHFINDIWEYISQASNDLFKFYTPIQIPIENRVLNYRNIYLEDEITNDNKLKILNTVNSNLDKVSKKFSRVINKHSNDINEKLRVVYREDPTTIKTDLNKEMLEMSFAKDLIKGIESQGVNYLHSYFKKSKCGYMSRKLAREITNEYLKAKKDFNPKTDLGFQL